MRHTNEFTPTERLILQAVHDASKPADFAYLAKATGASPYSIRHLTQGMVKRNVLVRTSTACVSYFTLPQAAPVPVTPYDLERILVRLYRNSHNTKAFTRLHLAKLPGDSLDDKLDGFYSAARQFGIALRVEMADDGETLLARSPYSLDPHEGRIIAASAVSPNMAHHYDDDGCVVWGVL